MSKTVLNQAPSRDFSFVPDVSVVIPVYGCSSCLEELTERVLAAVKNESRTVEIIFVDDNSPDQAWERILELSQLHAEVRGLKLSRNFGQHAAISAGIARARGRAMIVMDCDLQDIPEEIPTLLAELKEDVEIVLGQRIERQDTWFKQAGSRTFYRTLGWLTDTNYDPSTANFGAYSRKVIDAMNAMPETDRFLPLLARWTGFRTVRTPVVHGERTVGKSSYTLSKLLQMATRIALSFSDKPLRLVMSASFALAGVGLCVAAFAVYRYLMGDIRVAGFTSILASVWLVGSFLMASIGVVGLYVGRMHNETKRRPQYLIWYDSWSNDNA
ncbi:glycosyltransferase family 2 protein [Stenotrophomonas geniculata]|jgi:dolichol-phosphate mannosyltransferase|uniref:Glycosyltransferase family 2 protein n=2 Tax=Stenotrophomonas TaxID=40323 RepID=A0ABW1N5B8_9GAMM|nr:MULTISPECIES: glycosyltransferase family 2 protein [Stenotrophomonas]MBH1639339.1 glycosyltransferase family 2 protein [Stenotrophomonas maltophilia]MCI1066546.1 glycosyltransferase family 2 protein [Stenotrophomonas maltophilia]MCI1091439.1 glycosyltransferase family 2 protein [Stenotrophomonas maltophilia]MCI1107666.1 glycosyltransferase family 2 protein [Stenotrophomonas maltophilia]MCI1129338.1 glycosyltransferase family 2 protein [Stenotrophomonas maltophilia]